MAVRLLSRRQIRLLSPKAVTVAAAVAAEAEIALADTLAAAAAAAARTTAAGPAASERLLSIREVDSSERVTADERAAVESAASAVVRIESDSAETRHRSCP